MLVPDDDDLYIRRPKGSYLKLTGVTIEPACTMVRAYLLQRRVRKNIHSAATPKQRANALM